MIRTLDWNLFDGHSDSSITSNTHFDPNHTDSGTSLPDNLGCINSTEKGCGLSTCETISPESPESIILEAPLLVWMASSTCFTRCQHCARPLSTDGIRLPYLCRNCHSQSYCSKDCARSAWASAHRFQCLTFATFALPLGRIEFDLTAAFRHLTLNCSNQLDQFTRKQTFFKSLGVKERLCFAFASVLETYLIQIWNIDDQIIDLQLLSEWLVRFKIVDNINSFQLETSEPLDHDATTPIGHAIYLYASLLNHSCRPNCSIDFDGTCARVRAQRFIRAGQELTISYLPSHLLIDRCQARTLLKTIFYFDCQCDVCEAT